ncbi:MAG: hypothetical protein WCT10_05005 [Patescibacteria group bacterium]|jgi:hypothetical protein
METLLLVFAGLIVALLVFSPSGGRGGRCHINLENLPLLAYRVLCNSGGSLPEAEFVSKLKVQIDLQRVGLLQTRAGKAREVLKELLDTGSVVRLDDGETYTIVKPLAFFNAAGVKFVEFSLKASGRGMDFRYF